MQKRILMSFGIIIIIVAGLLFLKEKFGINLNPLTLINKQKQTATKKDNNIEIEDLSGYKHLPKTYAVGETVNIVATFKNNGNDIASDSYTFKAYHVDGVWDTLKRDIKYQDRKSGAIVVAGKKLFTEKDLLEMVKELQCKKINGNCYDNINPNDQNNKYGGIEVKFEEPKYKLDFQSTVAKKASFSQKILFVPDSCGYYMLVIGNKKYWSSSGSGNSKVAFIAVDNCVKGQIASGVSDVRDNNIPVSSSKAKDKITEPVEQLPQAGSTTYILGIMLVFVGLYLKIRLQKLV